ncbi:uncharacterized protein LOC135391688 [Ornithodoros turicata]|uniref:uncharacterized protein LOC135391688 n=1 Tax=Ornithodoros turicata TaxID=34597 RepID=UPI0031390423
MKAHLKHHDHNLHKLREHLKFLKMRLKGLTCTSSPNLYLTVINKVRELNHELYADVQRRKENKLKTLQPHLFTAPSTTTVYTIPPNLPLSEPQRSLLSKGLSFAPSSRRPPDEFSLLNDSERFFRRLLLDAHFLNNPTSKPQTIFDNLNPRCSNWTPPPQKFPLVEEFIEGTRSLLSRNMPMLSTSFPNLNPLQLTALGELRSRDDIIIKPADKGGAVVVWRRDLYVAEAERQLSNTRYYEKLDEDSTTQHQHTVNQVITSEISSATLPSEAKSLIVKNAKASSFYLLPKIHKPDCPGRPIVSALSCPTKLISAYVDSILQPLVHGLPSYIKDTTNVLQQLSLVNHSGSCVLFTMDVISLYTVIPHTEGLLALRHFLDRRLTLHPPTHTLLRLAELVLTLNTFEFNGHFYNQKCGVAMGTKMGPSFANLFMGFIEERFFAKYDKPKPEFFQRYIDDIFGFSTTLSSSELQDFIDAFSNFHPAIKFTSASSHDTLNFLDLTISVRPSKLRTSIFYKETDSHSYLSYSSCHPRHVKDSIPFSQFLRLRRICSENSDFLNQLAKMKDFFTSRGYPLSLLDRAAARVAAIPRSATLIRASSNKKSSLPLTVEYHPSISNLMRQIKSGSEDLFNSGQLSTGTTVSYRRPPNLRTLLVRSHIQKDDELENGTFPCQGPRCLTCAHVGPNHRLQGSNGRYIHTSGHYTSAQNPLPAAGRRDTTPPHRSRFLIARRSQEGNDSESSQRQDDRPPADRYSETVILDMNDMNEDNLDDNPFTLVTYKKKRSEGIPVVGRTSVSGPLAFLKEKKTIKTEIKRFYVKEELIRNEIKQE